MPLRPELQTSTKPRRRVWVWWAAAACVAGIVLGWFALNQPQPEPGATVAREKRPAAPLPIDQQSKPVVEPSRVAVAIPATSRPSVGRKNERRVSAPAQSGDRTAPTVALSTEPAADTRLDSTATGKASVAAVRSPKRRFQVVHLNELQAEEEIRPTPHRTERFVRLGMGNTEAPSPEAIHPSISVPISSKSNQ
jgi:hypothetical protein